MTVDADDMAHPCTTDKYGNEIGDNGVSVAISELRDLPSAEKVLCDYHETGMVQFFSENKYVDGDVIRKAQECGYELSHATTRDRDGTSLSGSGSVGYAEFVLKDA